MAVIGYKAQRPKNLKKKKKKKKLRESVPASLSLMNGNKQNRLSVYLMATQTDK